MCAAARRVSRVQQRERLARGRLGHPLRRVAHELEAGVAAARLLAGLDGPVAPRLVVAEDAVAAEDPDEYLAENVFWVPKEVRWSLCRPTPSSSIGKLIDQP